MRKFIIIALLISIGSSLIYGQGGPPRGIEENERIKSMKIAFLTNKLQLSPEEAQMFWPLYNQYEEEERRIREEHRPEKDILMLSDEEARKFMLERFEMEEKLLATKREYFLRFLDILPIRKVAMLDRAERQFNLELVKRLQQQRASQQRRGNF
ncbi:MAG: hypothetical protein R3350_00275 [Saprospiraceae bacterium]|nr:hypothetical protein [Saprospiraceae bacterium]